MMASIIIYDNRDSEERIMLQENAKPRKQSWRWRKSISDLLVVDLVQFIKGDHDDLGERLIRHLIEVFQFEIKTIRVERKLDESTKYLWNILPTFDRALVTNFGTDWDATNEDFQTFCKKFKDIIFNMVSDEKDLKFDEAFETEKLTFF
ncbi:hypothetical protein B9Z55_023773 [Caenorhabditis nigoni]|uniref:Uncharacterized protein n=1 Tax=Caenorhabditis nigoni TaxID=1611254 RepID=A0A2G5SRC9_9PELO|nr:hypothetical protein B9Z55_023773 [Caenorhabditis nigoni]